MVLAVVESVVELVEHVSSFVQASDADEIAL